MDRPAYLLRYRFDTFAQLVRHLHMVEDAALLFLPGSKHGVVPAGRVLLDVSIVESAQQTSLRGEIISRVESGAWMQLGDTRLLTLLHDSQFEGRREPRLSTDALLQLCDDAGAQVIAQLLDLGTGGMRVRGAGRLIEGESYAVQLLNVPFAESDLGKAQVVRVEGTEAGLRFVSPRSPQVPVYLGVLLEAWMEAPEIEHEEGCCGQRGLHEPPLPTLRGRSALHF